MAEVMNAILTKKAFPDVSPVLPSVTDCFSPRAEAPHFASMSRMNESPHLLVVDDDPALSELLSRYLGEQGFSVRCASGGRALDALLSSGPRPDLLILDLMLPGEDGLSIARRLKAEGGPPIIMLSARGEDIDRIVGLEVGADDYLAKPFNPRELLARIRAVLRRTGEAGTSLSRDERLRGGPFVLDTATLTAWRNGSELLLTPAEFRLLHLFMTHPNRVLSRDTLVDWLKGYERSAFDRSIDVRVTRLRRKIEPDVRTPRHILTVWGEGYLFSPEGRTPQQEPA